MFAKNDGEKICLTPFVPGYSKINLPGTVAAKYVGINYTCKENANGKIRLTLVSTLDLNVV